MLWDMMQVILFEKRKGKSYKKWCNDVDNKWVKLLYKMFCKELLQGFEIVRNVMNIKSKNQKWV